MNFRELYMMVLDKLNLPEGDRRIDTLIKSYINEAYIYIARFDHGVAEMELEMDAGTSVLYLPKTFLSMKRVVHPIEGTLDKSDYKIINNRLILNSYLDNDGSIKVIISLVPKELVEDTDVPEINRKYHIGLVYYALFLYNNDEMYWNLFGTSIQELIDQELSDEMDGKNSMEYVKDVYFNYPGGDY